MVVTHWNSYTPLSESKLHFDDGNVGKSISAVYNLHTNDGGTQIEKVVSQTPSVNIGLNIELELHNYV